MYETIHQMDKTNDDMATFLHTKLDNQVDKGFCPQAVDKHVWNKP